MTGVGFRAGRLVAEHEAAHAVIAVLTGRIVLRVSIAPSEAEHADWHGSMWCDSSGISPAPLANADLSAAGHIDVSAAGVAWELLASRKCSQPPGICCRGARRHAWEHAREDRENYPLVPFLAAVARVRRTLRRPEVAAAVEAVADALQARKSGELPGGTAVDKIVLLHVPGLARRRHPDGRLVGGLVPAATVPGAATDSGLTAEAARASAAFSAAASDGSSGAEGGFGFACGCGCTDGPWPSQGETECLAGIHDHLQHGSHTHQRVGQIVPASALPARPHCGAHAPSGIQITAGSGMSVGGGQR
jgi:hypothetical protein